MRNTLEKDKTTTENTDKPSLIDNQEQAGCCACIFSLFSNRGEYDRLHTGMSNEQLIRVAGMM
ncbi:MAG: hypothetical protein Q8L78_02435 [Coxiellaceae bacterium]|nr:hypothetical protein [Coxiellaceae bacterium]